MKQQFEAAFESVCEQLPQQHSWTPLQKELQELQSWIARTELHKVEYQSSWSYLNDKLGAFISDKLMSGDRVSDVKIARKRFLAYKTRLTTKLRATELKDLCTAIDKHKLNNRMIVTRLREFARVYFEPLGSPPKGSLSPSAMNDYWKALFSRDPATIKKCFTRKQCPKAPGHKIVWEINAPPSPSEVSLAISQMANGKAAGPDAICAETLKYCGGDLCDKLAMVYTRLWPKDYGGDGEKFPREWCSAETIPLYKGKGDPNDPGNQRSIFLLDQAGKGLSRILINRIEPLVNDRLDSAQYGFRRARGTVHAILALRSIQQHVCDQNVPLIATFVDVEKAFDSPPHKTFRQVLEHIGVPPAVVGLLLEFHRGTRCHVVGAPKSLYFSLGRGGRQGSVEAPTLFNLVWNIVLETALKDIDGVGIEFVRDKCKDGFPFPEDWGSSKFVVRILIYADDLVFFTRDLAKAGEVLEAIQRVGSQIGVRINCRKTKALYLSGKPTTVGPLNFGQEQVEIVPEFEYLGSIITENRPSCGRDVKHAISRSQKALRKFNRLFGAKGLPADIRARIIKMFVLPGLFYACETWSTTDTCFRELDAYMNRLRLIILNRKRGKPGVSERLRGFKNPVRQGLKNNHLVKVTRKIFPTSARSAIAKRRLQVLCNLVSCDMSAPSSNLLFARLPAVEGMRIGGKMKGHYLNSIRMDYAWATGSDRKRDLVSFLEETKSKADSLFADTYKELPAGSHPLICIGDRQNRFYSVVKGVARAEIRSLFASKEGKAFRSKKTPKLLRERVKNWVCDWCDHTANRKNDYYRHMRKYHGQTKQGVGHLICPVEDCQASFKREGWLRRHLKTNHQHL